MPYPTLSCLNETCPIVLTWPGRELGPVVIREVDDITVALVRFVSAVKLEIAPSTEGDAGSVSTGEFLGGTGREGKESLAWGFAAYFLLSAFME